MSRPTNGRFLYVEKSIAKAAYLTVKNQYLVRVFRLITIYCGLSSDFR